MDKKIQKDQKIQLPPPRSQAQNQGLGRPLHPPPPTVGQHLSHPGARPRTRLYPHPMGGAHAQPLGWWAAGAPAGGGPSLLPLRGPESLACISCLVSAQGLRLRSRPPGRWSRSEVTEEDTETADKGPAGRNGTSSDRKSLQPSQVSPKGSARRRRAVGERRSGDEKPASPPRAGGKSEDSGRGAGGLRKHSWGAGLWGRGDRSRLRAGPGALCPRLPTGLPHRSPGRRWPLPGRGPMLHPTCTSTGSCGVDTSGSGELPLPPLAWPGRPQAPPLHRARAAAPREGAGAPAPAQVRPSPAGSVYCPQPARPWTPSPGRGRAVQQQPGAGAPHLLHPRPPYILFQGLGETTELGSAALVWVT